jgi:hypothetical protein
MISSKSALGSTKVFAWAIGFLLIGSLLSISTDLLTHWRNEDSLYDYSLRYVHNGEAPCCRSRHLTHLVASRMDPTDWKLYDQRAENLLQTGRCTPDETECRNLWILANEFSPRGNLKGQLYRLHLLLYLRQTDRACDGYLSLLKDHPDNASVHNNAAVCLAISGRMAEARREFSLALECPDIPRTTAYHTLNARNFEKWEKERARHNADDSPGFKGIMTY